MRFDLNWWNTSVFCIIPILSVVIVFFIKRKLLWIAPFISTVLSVVISIIAMPSILRNGEHRAMFFGISIPIQLLIVIILTVIAYLVAYILKYKKAKRICEWITPDRSRVWGCLNGMEWLPVIVFAALAIYGLILALKSCKD